MDEQRAVSAGNEVQGDIERVVGESVLFLRADDGIGWANLQHLAAGIEGITSSDGMTHYEVGRDVEWTDGSRRLRLTSGSRIHAYSEAELRRPAGSQAYALTHRDGNGEILFGPELEWAEMQLCVTYRCHPSTVDASGDCDREQLSRIRGRLLAGAPCKIVVLGDSISYGHNASGLYGKSPFQPPYPGLVANALRERYASEVQLVNLSVSGTNTEWGITRAADVVAERPDLVILAFGMNDSVGVSAEQYQRNMARIRSLIQESAPECDFILVAPMLGNPDWTALRHEVFPKYRDALAALCEPGTALADLTRVWERLLSHKNYLDLTGNGVNHPNDFGHRVYAAEIAALLG